MPLGFRLSAGKIEFESVERAARKLIRAELNIVLRQQRRKEEQFRSRWGRLVPLLNALRLTRIPPETLLVWGGSSAGDWRRYGFVNGVDFAEVHSSVKFRVW